MGGTAPVNDIGVYVLCIRKQERTRYEKRETRHPISLTVEVLRFPRDGFPCDAAYPIAMASMPLTGTGSLLIIR